jgi:beta-galactosidase
MPKPEPINPRLPRLWHGGDYNPDQWPDQVRRDDVRLMKLAHVNVATLAVFSWAQLEPQPGLYDWDWLDETFERLEAAGVYVALATPTAAHPRWLSAMHPDVQAVDASGVRLPHGERQRFCPTSPLFREHAARMDRALAERYGRRPALVLWHVSNEYVSRCWCHRCAEAFREWLRRRYGTLEAMNHEYWASFWSHAFTDWSQVMPPYPACGRVPHGLRLDWQRFQTHAVCEFFKHEAAILREATPGVPLTTNLMGWFGGLDYAPLADVMDVISWDSYPQVTADPARTAASHALMRGLKENKPWLLMEQTPSSTNWMAYPMLKPPGVVRLQSWQAIGHGSDAAMYFQWRRSRGGPEKFHGAVVAHVGNERPRVFQEVAALGAELERTGDRIVGSRTAARVGVLWSQDNRWALENSAGPGQDKRVVDTAIKHFKAVWRNNIPADVVRPDADWSVYDLLVAPQLYMVKSGRYPLDGSPEELKGRLDEARKIERWVEGGGTFVATHLSGLVNESDLVYEGGYPGPLRNILGVWVEEVDVPEPAAARNEIVLRAGAFAGARPRYACERIFELAHAERAGVLAVYGSNWYAGRPCLTINPFGQGRAYYLATDPEEAFLADFYRALAADAGIAPLLEPVEGVEVLERTDGRGRLLFILNHAAEPREVPLGGIQGRDLLAGRPCAGRLALGPYGVAVVEVQ